MYLCLRMMYMHLCCLYLCLYIFVHMLVLFKPVLAPMFVYMFVHMFVHIFALQNSTPIPCRPSLLDWRRLSLKGRSVLLWALWALWPIVVFISTPCFLTNIWFSPSTVASLSQLSSSPSSSHYAAGPSQNATLITANWRDSPSQVSSAVSSTLMPKVVFMSCVHLRAGLPFIPETILFIAVLSKTLWCFMWPMV